jgi:hypothetical protein
VRLGLRLPPEAPDSDLYRRDLRAPGGEGHAWEIELESATPAEEITLEAIAERELTGDVSVRLIDRELASAVDLRGAGGRLGSYRLLSYGPNRAYRLTLLAGTAGYLSHPPGAELMIPSRLTMDQAVPNPSHSSMRIRFGLPQPEPVTVEIFDVTGQRVATLLDHAWQVAGYHALLWDGTGHAGAPAPSGIYFCHMVTGQAVLTRRIVRLD